MTSSEVTLRLTAAALTGAVLGVNRKLRGKAAGLRTHALVALGSALAVVTGELVVGTDRGAITRVIQGIIAGIGFLGAGAIIKQGAATTVRGLTTAATIWLAASVGVACGAGLYQATLVALGLALLVLVIGGPIESLVRAVLGTGDEEREREQERGRERDRRTPSHSSELPPD
jgi:putative Mg2+ transporter-C (MgtC) family protein